MEITSKVFALGNSNAVRFPQAIMEALSLRAEDFITMDVNDRKELIIKKKQSEDPYPSIKTLFAGYSGDYKPHEEFEGMVGKEMI